MTFKFTALILFGAFLIMPNTSHAAKWQVDHTNSKIGIVASVSGAKAEGHFESFKAGIDFDPEDLSTARIIVDVDMSSAKMKDPQQTTTLSGSDWFNTAQFPHATFTSTQVKATGNGTFEMSADLTLKGKTLPVKLPFTFTTNNDEAHAVGELVIMRNDFGVGQGQFSSGSMVGFEVKLMIDITAKK